MSNNIVLNYNRMEIDEIDKDSKSGLKLPIEKLVVKKISKTLEAKKLA
jgi:hypothetical protein